MIFLSLLEPLSKTLPDRYNRDVSRMRESRFRSELSVGAGRCFAYIVLALVVSACNLRRPEVTLTLAPIETRTPEATKMAVLPTETVIARKSPTRTATAKPSLTATDLPTVVPTDTSTTTFTPAPTDANTPTPTASEIVAPTETHTSLPTVTDTVIPTDTATLPPTLTETAEPTETFTSAPTATNTARPTATFTPTQEPSPTKILPRTPVSTEPATPTTISRPSATSTVVREQIIRAVATDAIAATASIRETFPPTLTALPTLDETELAQLLATPLPRPTSPAIWTAVPTSIPTAPISVVLGASTPALATATPGVDRPLVSTPLPESDSPVLGPGTLTPTPTRFQPTVAVRPELIVEQIPPPVSQPVSFNTLGASVYQFDVGAQQQFNFENLSIGGGVVLFAKNPRGGDSYVRTDQVGMLFYRALNGGGERTMENSPFHAGFLVPSSDANKNRVVEIDWSADGAQFTFRIDTPPGQDNVNAGVWFWQPVNASPTDPTYPVIRDCVREGYISCQLVNPSNASFWKTIDVAWSPLPGSNSILLTLQLTEEGRNALAIVQAVRDANYARQAPEFFRYEYGHWNTNGNGIIVSGRRHDGRVIIGEVNNDLRGERVIFDASAAGLWVQDAVRRPNDQIVALGRLGGPYDNAPVALYNQNGTRLSGFIGGAAPEAVRWYPQRDRVVVTVHGRQYTVQVDGGHVIDTTDLTRNPSFGSGNIGSAPIPSAVIQGSEYQPGDQLRSVHGLNVRQEPSTSTQIIGGLFAGDYVAIIAGPYDNEGYRWWRVQTANNVVGWIAGTIGGRPTIVRP